MLVTLAWRFLAVLGVVLVLWFGLQPEPAPNLVANSDKWTHLLAFGMASMAMLLALPEWPRGFTVIVMLALGLIIELGQATLLPHRSFDLMDLLVNAIGIMMALFLFWLLQLVVFVFGGKRD